MFLSTFDFAHYQARTVVTCISILSRQTLACLENNRCSRGKHIEANPSHFYSRELSYNRKILLKKKKNIFAT